MIIGRLLAGIGIGISSAIVPLYISEVVAYLILIRSLRVSMVFQELICCCLFFWSDLTN
jgi:hypothetical protein